MCKGAATVAESRAHQMESADAALQRISTEGLVPPAALLPPEPLKPPRTLQWQLEVPLDSLPWMPRPSPASPVSQVRPSRNSVGAMGAIHPGASSSTAPAASPADLSDSLSRSTETIVVTSRTLQRQPSDALTSLSRSTSAVVATTSDFQHPSDALSSSTRAIVATTSALQHPRRLGLPASLASLSPAEQAVEKQGARETQPIQQPVPPPAQPQWRLVCGAYSIMGKKLNFPGFPNQDRFVVVPISEQRVFAAVLDGHGWKGHAVARAAAQFFEAHAPSVGALPATQLTSALSTLFHQAHNMVVHDGLASMSGTTATVALIDVNAGTITTAHVGDSRLIVCADAELCFATRDHVIDANAERHIRSCGGEVRAAAYNGVAARRVFMPGAELPGLGMSRALGDVEAHSLGITCEPEVHAVPFEPSAGGIVIATDGLWDKFSPQMVAERLVTAEGFASSDRGDDEDPYANDLWLQDFTQLLVQEGRSRWSDDGDIDDVTAVVVKAVPVAM